MPPKDPSSAPDNGQNNAQLHITDKQLSIFLDDTHSSLNKAPEAYNAQAGISMIDKWETILVSSGKPGLAKIIYELGTLKELLREENPDAHEIAASLATLGDETKKVAENTMSGFKGPLMEFGNLLIKAASSLSK